MPVHIITRLIIKFIHIQLYRLYGVTHRLQRHCIVYINNCIINESIHHIFNMLFTYKLLTCTHY